MQVELVAEIDRDAQRLRIRARVGQSRSGGLLHDVAQLARQVEVALARHRDHLDREQHATHLGPGEPVRHPDQRLLVPLIRLELRRAEQIVEAMGRDRHPSGPPGDHFARDLATDTGDRSLQVANAGLAGVAVDHGGNRRPGDLDVLIGEPVIRELLGDQELTGDHHLLFGRIPR